jgi:hypothetical protein
MQYLFWRFGRRLPSGPAYGCKFFSAATIYNAIYSEDQLGSLAQKQNSK